MISRREPETPPDATPGDGPDLDPGPTTRTRTHVRTHDEARAPRLAVVILAYATLEGADALARHLITGGIATDDITIVFNPAGDLPDEPASASTTILPMRRNVGYPAAMNAGIEHVRHQGAEVVALLTHDTTIDADSLQTLTEAVRADHSIGLAGPVLRDAETGAVHSAGGVIDVVKTRHDASQPPPGTVRRCDWLDGAALVARGEVLDELGGFDERFFLYGEDLDLCLRVRASGRYCAVVADAEATTRSGIPSREALFRFLSVRNLLESYRKAGDLRHVERLARRTLSRARTHGWRGPEMRGLAAFVARRFGPPPADLSADSDVVVAPGVRC